MSYILEALRKSERQRQIGEVPRVHSFQDGYAAEPAGRNPWILVAVIAILVNISVGGWFWWQHQQSAANHSGTQALPSAQPAQPASPLPLPASRPLSQPLSQSAPHQASTTSSALTTALPASPTAPSRAAPSAPAYAPSSYARQQPPPELEDVVVFESLATPTAPAAPAAHRYTDLIDISQLSGPLHLAMLALNLNVHVYDNHPSQRFVLIDMKRYAEGHALPQGPVIEAITPDGVVLAYQGQRFLLPRN